MSNIRSITPNAQADFTPQLGNYKTLQPFRYWCQKVLPLVYDDSLSYYELLCKVIDYLNKTMEDVETLHGDVTNLHSAYEELQNYVNEYFNGLDVQEEINNKLDIMATDGTLLRIIAPTISESTSNWLNEHITNPTNPPIDSSLTIRGGAADAKSTGDRVLLNFDNIETLTDLFDKVNVINPLNMEKITRNSILDTSDGKTIQPNDNYGTTDYIRVTPNSVLRGVQNPIGSSNAAESYVRFWFCYDQYKNFVSYSDGSFDYTVPANCYWVRCSMVILTTKYTDTYYGGIYVNHEIDKWYPYTEINYKLKLDANTDLLLNSLLLSYGATINTPGVLTTTNINKNKTLTCFCSFNTFSSITIGHGNDVNTPSSKIIIDNENITVYSDLTHSIKEKHNLSINKYLLISITVDDKYKAKITIISNGYYELVSDWDGSISNVYANIGNSTDSFICNWFCNDFSSKIWMYGDSYFGLTNPARWTSYLINEGFGDNALTSAYPGCNSKSALNSLKNDLKYGTPKYLFWCLGMNDGDTQTSVNTNWHETINEVIEICKTKNIVLILSTIPCTPTINNTFKNGIVKTLKYRYVDFAKFVGGENVNSNWFTGMLSTDNVHPTELGAKALYAAVKTYFNELFYN